MRSLLLGGTGFLGTTLARQLRARGDDVVTVSRAEQADVRMDARDLSALRSLLRRDRFDAVVNLMGTGLATATASPTSLSLVNAELPAVILATLLDTAQPPVFVHAASSTERTADDESDESDYSRSKHEGALALRALAHDATTPVALLRIHNTYGPDQPETRFVAGTVEALRARRPVRLNYPDRVRDFVHVDDVTSSFLAVLDDPIPRLREEDIGTGQGTRLMDLALLVADLLDRPPALVTGASPAPVDPHPHAVARTLTGTLGTCVTSLRQGLTTMTGGR